MIQVDIEGLERLTDTMTGIVSGTEELIGQLRCVLAEMQDDPELAAFPQSAAAVGYVGTCADRAVRVNDTAISLKNIMQEAVDGYKEKENKFSESLMGALSTLSSLQIGLSAASAAELIPIEQEEASAGHNRLQRLVAESAGDLQLTNLAAVSKIIEDEYGVTGSGSARLKDDVSRNAGDVAMTGVMASAIKTDETDDADVGFKNISADNGAIEGLKASVAAAENIRTDDTDSGSGS